MKNYLFLFLVIVTVSPTYSQKKKEILYVGTSSLRESKGIYVYEFDANKGSLRFLQSISDVESPTFIALHPSGKYLYAVNLASMEGGDDTGSVTAYTIDLKTGKLKFLNHVSSYGKRPCHVSVDKTGSFVFVSNYDEGNVVMLSILQDGSVGAVADSKKYGGQDMNAEQPSQPHINAAVVSPNNKFVYVTDLGSDKIYSYSLDLKNGKLNPTGQGEVSMAKATGPRHFTFHPKGTFAYLSEEVTSSVASFSVNLTSGALTVLQDTVRSLPEDFTGKNTSADIQTDKRGNFLYLSNRGSDLLAIYSIRATGEIKLKGHQTSGGKTPRYLAFNATGKYVLVANENSDTISVLEQNPTTGLLIPKKIQVKVPSPVCLQFLMLK